MLRLDARALRSQVAQHIFLVFVACSMLPVAAFALFAFWQVRSQLEADARVTLRHASKTAGMSILERLMLADEELKVLVDQSGASAAKGPMAPRAGARIQSVEHWAPARVETLLSGRQREHLDSGYSVVWVDSQDGPPARVHLLRRGASSTTWAAELSPEFVFAPRRRKFTDQYFVRNDEGRVLFESPPGAARPSSPLADVGSESERAFSREGPEGPELGARTSLFLRAQYQAPAWNVAFSRPLREVRRPLHDFETSFPLMALATFGAALALSLTQIRRSFVPIDRLTEATRRVSSGDFDAQVEIHTGDEFETLGRAFNGMTGEIGRRIRVLGAMNGVGRALSAELNTEALLGLILRESMRVTGSVGAALFLALDGAPLRLARLNLAGDEGEPVESAVGLAPDAARRCVARGATFSAAGVSDLPDHEQEAWQSFERHIETRIGPLVAVPMRDGRGDTMGALILFRGAESAGYDSESCELVESLASQAATAITKNHLVDSFRALFEGVIELTVRAIDEKSSYTGDHCRKVPILTELIADAACAATLGPLKNFNLSDDERYELRIAALLHDCGKVATPVHVMDKATKLETIFDRIALVDARFEIARREALASEAHPDELARRLEELEAERRFLHGCNRGVEAMSDADVRRVRRIAETLGYSAANGERVPLLEEDEVRNLTIRRGTLNPEERKVIEQHVVTTIDLLSELPFPRALRAVPEIAGSHHERVDGGGYPNHLTREQITLQGRILGLADVFEALTARDRPYKPGRSLSETFRILDDMRDEGAIDPDLYDLFKQEKVYLRYLAENVAPEQIDGVYWEELERFTSVS